MKNKHSVYTNYNCLDKFRPWKYTHTYAQIQHMYNIDVGGWLPQKSNKATYDEISAGPSAWQIQCVVSFKVQGTITRKRAKKKRQWLHAIGPDSGGGSFRFLRAVPPSADYSTQYENGTILGNRLDRRKDSGNVRRQLLAIPLVNFQQHPTLNLPCFSRDEDYAEMIRAIPPSERSVSDFAPRACEVTPPEIASRGPNLHPCYLFECKRELEKITTANSFKKKYCFSLSLRVRILNFAPRRGVFLRHEEIGKLNRRRICCVAGERC